MGDTRDILVFDMDGVLVNVSESYRESIRETVKLFTGQDISKDLIQEYKNAGGWNNDWALSQKIVADLGREVDYATIVAEFQKIFFGDNGTPGLILRERWLPGDGLLGRLCARFQLSIFTGRNQAEAAVTLHRFAHDYTFSPIITDDDVKNSKPAPDGLFLIMERNPGRKIWYIGDTVDDARASRAANVPFIGIAGSENPKREELVELLKSEGAIAVLESINELESVL